jgi:hypothetical protein
MSTEIATYDEELARFATAMAAQERPNTATISLKSGVMMYQKQPIKDNKLPCVIISAAWENTWYSQPYDANKIVPPDCFALAQASGEEKIIMRPHPDSMHIQGGSLGACATCPKFQWDSDPRPTSRGKACKEKRRLVLIPLSAIENKEALAEGEFATLTVPVTSVANWAAYANKLAGSVKRPHWAVISEISTKPHPRNQFEVNFTMLAKINFDEAPWLMHGLAEKVQKSLDVLLAPYEKMAAEQPPAEPAKGKKY